MDTKQSVVRPWPWPDSLDAVIAAGNHHRVLLENDRVRVLEVRIPRGDTVPIYTSLAEHNLRRQREQFRPARWRWQRAVR